MKGHSIILRKQSEIKEESKNEELWGGEDGQRRLREVSKAEQHKNLEGVEVYEGWRNHSCGIEKDWNG